MSWRVRFLCQLLLAEVEGIVPTANWQTTIWKQQALSNIEKIIGERNDVERGALLELLRSWQQRGLRCGCNNTHDFRVPGGWQKNCPLKA